jgi:hypothetical protein
MRLFIYQCLLIITLFISVDAHAKTNSFTGLGATINTPEKELYPVVNGNADLVLFSRLYNRNGETVTDLLLSRKNIQWQTPIVIPVPTTIKGFKGCTYLSENGSTLLFFTENAGIRELYQATLSNNTLTNVEKFDSRINSKIGEGAWLSANGNVLYFSAAKDFSKGGTDIYKIEKAKNGKWRNATELSERINTEANEQHPILISDKLLFFSRTENNQSGIYLSHTFDEYRTKAKPVLFPEANGLKLLIIKPNNTLRNAILCTEDAQGNTDIYEATLTDEQVSTSNALITGHVLLGEKMKAINANIYACGTTKVFKSAKERGSFVINAKPGQTERYIVEAEGYEKISFTLNVPFSIDFQEYYVQVLMDKLNLYGSEIGQSGTLKILDLNKANMENVSVATASSKLFETDAERYENLEDAIYQPDSNKRKSAANNLFFESPLMVSNEAKSGVINQFGNCFYDLKNLNNVVCGGKEVLFNELTEPGLPNSGILSETKLLKPAYKLSFTPNSAEINASQQTIIADLVKQCLAKPENCLVILVFRNPNTKDTKTLFSKRSTELLNQLKFNQLNFSKVCFVNTKDISFTKIAKNISTKDQADTFEMRLVTFRE